MEYLWNVQSILVDIKKLFLYNTSPLEREGKGRWLWSTGERGELYSSKNMNRGADVTYVRDLWKEEKAAEKEENENKGNPKGATAALLRVCNH